MKLNNKGFAISSIMYIILVLAVTLIALTLAILSSRKLILDRLTSEVTDIIYEEYTLTYREALNTLKEEIIMYASSNNIEKDSVKISEFETSVDSNDLKGYKLSDKYLTVISNNNSYDVYIGEAETLNGSAALPENTIDISDYKIYGNTYQETSVQGKNLINIDNGLNSAFIKNSDGTYTMEYNSSGRFSEKFYVSFEVGKTYTFSYELIETNSTYKSPLQISIKYEDGTNSTKGFETSSSVFQITPTKEIEYFRLYQEGDMPVGTYTTFKNLQIEEGNTATQYEKFSPNMPSTDYPSEVLSVGDRTINLYERKKENLSSNDAYIGLDMRDWEKTAYTLQLRLKEGKTIPANTYFGFLFEDKSAFWLIQDGAINPNYPEMLKMINTSTLNGVACYPSSNIEAIWDALDIFLVKGDYTTETIPPYEPYDKYKIPVKLGGKNLLPYPYTKTTMTVNGITYTDLGDGGINVNGTSSTWAPFNLYIGESNPFEAGKKYTFSKNQIGEGNVSFLLYYLDENGAGKWAASGILWKEEYTFEQFYLQVDPDVTIDNVTLYPQVEEGNVATSYEPYVGSVTTNIYLDEPLKKIENSTDELLYNNKTFVKNIYEYIITGSEADINAPWRFSGGYGSEIRSPILNYIGYPKNTVALSNYYPYFASNNYLLNHLRIISDLSSYGYIAINDLNYPGEEYVDEFVSNLTDLYASGNPVKVYYPLKDTVINELDLPRIQTLGGKVYLSIDTEIEPSKFEFTVIKKIKQL